MNYLDKLLEALDENKKEIEKEMNAGEDALFVGYKKGSQVGLKIFADNYSSIDILRSIAEHHPIFRVQMEAVLSLIKTDNILSIYENVCKEEYEEHKRGNKL